MSLIRKIDGFPHCGNVFVCGDRLRNSSVNEVVSALNFNLQKGLSMKPGNGGARRNFPPGVNHGSTIPAWADLPLVGHQSQYKAYPTYAFAEYPCEIIEEFDQFCIQASIRLLPSESWKNSINPNPPGVGQRAAVMRFDWFNSDLGTSQPVLHIYNDLAYYQATYGLIDASVAIDYSTLEPSDSEIKQIIILGQFDSSVIDPGNRSAGWLQVHVDYRENFTGGNWTGNQINNGYVVIPFPTVHPETNNLYMADGVLDCAVQCFNDQDQLPYHDFGTGIPSVDWDAYVDNTEKIKLGGFTGTAGHGRVNGGIIIPVVGYYGPDVKETATQAFTTEVQIPPNVTNVVLMALMKFDGSGSRDMTINITLEKNTPSAGPVTQQLYNNQYSFAGSTPIRLHFDIAMTTAMIPVSGQVEYGKLILTQTLTNPRSNANENPNYWTGVFSYLLRFYDA